MHFFPGLQYRPCLAYQERVVEIITEAQHMDEYTKAKWSPNIRNLPIPKWSINERRKLVGKQPPPTLEIRLGAEAGKRKKAIVKVSDDQTTVKDRDEVRALGIPGKSQTWELKRRCHNAEAATKGYHVIEPFYDKLQDAKPIQCRNCKYKWTLDSWKIVSRGQQCAKLSQESQPTPVAEKPSQERTNIMQTWRKAKGMVPEHNSSARRQGKHIITGLDDQWDFICKVCACKWSQYGTRKFLSMGCPGPSQ